MYHAGRIKPPCGAVRLRELRKEDGDSFCNEYLKIALGVLFCFVFFIFIFLIRSCCVSQAGLELLGFSAFPESAFLVVGVTGLRDHLPLGGFTLPSTAGSTVRAGQDVILLRTSSREESQHVGLDLLCSRNALTESFFSHLGR